MKQDQVIAAVERFYAAVTQKGKRADLREATRGLLEALTTAAQGQVTDAALLLLERLDDHERRLVTAERRIENADHLAIGASKRASEVARQTDAQIDRLREEQADPAQLNELIRILYQQVTRTSDHEQRITTIEQRHDG